VSCATSNNYVVYVDNHVEKSSGPFLGLIVMSH
jgi:hypothetical protein